jgi:hypothetical protein
MRLKDVLFHGDPRTGELEPLAMSGAAFLLAGILPMEREMSGTWETITQ